MKPFKDLLLFSPFTILQTNINYRNHRKKSQSYYSPSVSPTGLICPPKKICYFFSLQPMIPEDIICLFF